MNYKGLRPAATLLVLAALVHQSYASTAHTSTSWASGGSMELHLGMKSRVHPRFKTKYRVDNWAEYDRSLMQRGDITLWISPDAIDEWKPEPSGRRGGQRKYSNTAIETALTLRLVFKLPLRQAEGFLRSIHSAARTTSRLAWGTLRSASWPHLHPPDHPSPGGTTRLRCLSSAALLPRARISVGTGTTRTPGALR
jgi:hypothetical protein